jgi:NitT/TauT family transport system substrate-binding protein
MSSRICRSLLLAACAAALSYPALAQDLKTWRDGVVEAKSDAGFVFMASRGGFAEREGIKLDMVQFKGDAIALRATLAGELDSYEGNPGAPLIAASRGADIKVIGCYWPVQTAAVFVRAGISTVQDLKDKQFAISSPGSLPDLLARAVLAQSGISDADVRFAVMGSDTDRFRALSAGLVDAAVISTEFEPTAASYGIKLLVHPHDAVPNYMRFCTYTTGSVLAQRHDAIVGFLAAEIKALRFALANRDKFLEVTRDVTGIKPDDPRPAHIFGEVQKYDAIDPDMPVLAEKLDWMQNLLVKTGNMSKTFDVKTMIADGPLKEAMARAGK